MYVMHGPKGVSLVNSGIFMQSKFVIVIICLCKYDYKGFVWQGVSQFVNACFLKGAI